MEGCGRNKTPETMNSHGKRTLCNHGKEKQGRDPFKREKKEHLDSETSTLISTL
jgi:hypothetical protein